MNLFIHCKKHFLAGKIHYRIGLPLGRLVWNASATSGRGAASRKGMSNRLPAADENGFAG